MKEVRFMDQKAKAKFTEYLEGKQIRDGEALYNIIDQDPLRFAAELHAAWPQTFALPEGQRKGQAG
jgi:hypothetical protein